MNNARRPNASKKSRSEQQEKSADDVSRKYKKQQEVTNLYRKNDSSSLSLKEVSYGVTSKADH